MRDLRLPPPPVSPEAMAQIDFLPELRDIDTFSGSALWVLSQAVVGVTQEDFSARQLHDRVARLGSYRHSKQVPALRSSGRQIGKYIADELAPANLVVSSQDSDHSFATPMWRATAKASENMGKIGVFVATQLSSDLHLGTVLGRKSPKAIKGSPYPYAPTLRLRMAQLMIAYEGARVRDITKVVKRTPAQVHALLEALQEEGVVVPGPRVGYDVCYRLQQEAERPITQLLCSLVSLGDASYNQAASRVAHTLLDPHRSPSSVLRFADKWRRPRGFSTKVSSEISPEALDVFAEQFAPRAPREDVLEGVGRLVSSGVVLLVTDESGKAEAILNARLSGMSSFELDLLMQALGGDVFAPVTTSDPRLVEGEVRRAGYADKDRYVKERLLPKVRDLLRAA